MFSLDGNTNFTKTAKTPPYSPVPFQTLTNGIRPALVKVPFRRELRFDVGAIPMTIRINRLVSEESLIVLHVSGWFGVESVKKIASVVERVLTYC